jgi:ABC-type branched-subunit amino acid transport system ATPase component
VPTVTTALRTHGVGISFGGVRAVQDVSISVAPGEIVGIIGPNGAGKTTLFDCISGNQPHQGQVLIGDRDVTGLAPQERARAGLGRSFQDARLFHTMTVLDTLRVASERHNPRGSGAISTLIGRASATAAERKADEQARAVIDAFGLSAYRDKLIGELSTGTRRVVDLAGILVQRPSVVLLDEPSSGIAQKEAEALGPLLLQLRAELGCAMVVIEHDMPLLLGLAERLVALETGSVIAEGAPQDVIRHPEVVRSYLGSDQVAIQRSGAV